MVAAVYGAGFNRASRFDDNHKTIYDTDPTYDDAQWLLKQKTLTPECFANAAQGDYLGTCNSYTSNISVDILKSIDPPANFLIESPRFFSTDVATKYARVAKAPFLFIDAAFDGGADCRANTSMANGGFVKSSCFRRSFVDIIERFEELAKFLGIESTEQTKADKAELCLAAKNLQEAGKLAHERGVRTMGGAIYPSGVNTTIYLTNPLQFHTLRSLEGLGVPMMWPGKCEDTAACYTTGPIPEGFEQQRREWMFPKCTKDSVTPECASDDPLYPVDFWFLEGNTYTASLAGKLSGDFPDKAIVAGQYYFMDANEGVLSYKAAAAYFNNAAAKLKQAKALYDNKSDKCTDVDHTANSHINYLDGGLEGGQYACYNAKHHDEYSKMCSGATTSGSMDTSKTGIGALTTVAAVLFM